jgi:cytochrome c2
MADRGDTHYLTSTLNKWFLFSSLVLLAATVWMMISDWDSPWKKYQREYKRIDLEKTKAAYDALETPEAQKGEAALKAAVEKAQADLVGKKSELDTAQAELFKQKGEMYNKDQAAKFAKADLDWTKYLVEEYRTDHAQPSAQQDKLDTAQDKSNATALDKERMEQTLKGAQNKVDDLMASVSGAEKTLAAQTRDQERLRKRMDQLAPDDKAVQVANVIRDAPGLDFVGPTLKVQKVVLDNLTFELNFTKAKRVDMCMTCHMPIDKEGWSDKTDEEPLRSHPRLDLFLTAKSPHPVKDVGCTICHRGGGEALDFVRADHRPQGEKQEEEWRAKYDWHKQHHWDYPMLSQSFIEASCVQCHKTSMELIADEAPKVTQGYRLFEQYGCYACHKVDWFPTSRKPGPSLKNIAQKVRPDFIASWVTKPKSFRPTTWMPQIFHVENFAENEVVVKSNYGAGPEIKGQQWNDTAVASVTAFILSRSGTKPLDPIPVKGDAERGREVFRVSGCLGCHNMAPFPGEEAKTQDLAFEKATTNEHGPNLRGVAAKVNAQWLYWWVKDPSKYWPDTRMPNLRLPDQDAADITAYITDDPDAIFHDVPKGWAEKPSPLDAETLREQARWFFSKVGREELARRLDGKSKDFPWNDMAKLEVAVGEQFVTFQGCFSCHEIGGMEDMMPIGTELSNWGSKTVDKLDFAFAYRKPGEEREKIGDLPLLEPEYREGWLMRKLHAPRSFDIDKVKNPKEKLRMPWFDFTDEQVRSIATFVVGLVDDEVQRAKMVPTPQKQAKDAGMRAIRQKNCVACHVIDSAVVTFKDAHGDLQTIQAESIKLENDLVAPPMDGGLAQLSKYLDQYGKDNDDEVKEVPFRLLGPAPTVGAPGDTVFVPRKDIVDVKPPHGGRFVRVVTDYYMRGAPTFDAHAANPDDAIVRVTADPDKEKKIQDVDGKFRAYSGEPYDKVRWTFAPPVLINEGQKLQRDWFYAFLSDPMPLRQQIRVRMPTFHYYEGEAGAIADYFVQSARDNWASRYARTLRLVLGLDLKPSKESGSKEGSSESGANGSGAKGSGVNGAGAKGSASDAKDLAWPMVMLRKQGLKGMSVEAVAKGANLEPRTVRGIEAGSRPDIDSGLEKLRAFGEKHGFEMQGPVGTAYERVSRRAPSYLEARRKAIADNRGPLGLGHDVAIKGPNCYQCHFHQGEPPDQKESPIAWAPDLARAHERLRESWTEEWLWNPGLVYPGTSMPGNFQGDPPQYQQAYPNSSNADQVEVVLDWLFNLDRIGPSAQ